GRAHTEFALDYTMSPDTMYNWNRSWYDYDNRSLYSCAVINGGPARSLCHTPTGTYSNTFTNAGLINASPAGLANTPGNAAAIAAIRAAGPQYANFGLGTAGAANALRGIQFVGPNAQAVPFNFGVANITPTTGAVGGNCFNCSGNPDSNITNQSPTAVPFHAYNLFSYTSYKLTDSITASVMLNYGWKAENNIANNGRASTRTIAVDNAFIPDVVRAQMIAQNIPSISLGTGAIENLTNRRDVSMFNLSKSIAQNYVQNYRQLYRGVFTLNGAVNLLGEDWTWNAYAQNSSVRERQRNPYNTIDKNFNNAIDSVVVQATGPNSLGGGNPILAQQVTGILKNAGVPVPAVGSIACRSTLTTTTYGVVTDPVTGFNSVVAG